MLNLILGILWLTAGLGILGYELLYGPTWYRIPGINVSMGWFLLVLAAWNFVRWYGSRAWKAEQDAMRRTYEERLRQAQTRYHERPIVPDPTFDFSDKPAPPTDVMPPPQQPGERAP